VRTIGATAAAALAQGWKRVGYAVKIRLRDGTIWAITDFPTGVTIDGQAYSRANFRVTGLPAEANPALWKASLRLGDGAGTYRAAIRDNSIRYAEVWIYALLSPDPATAPGAVLLFKFRVEKPSVNGPSVDLQLGPPKGLWEIQGPPVYSATCTYPQERNTPLCDKALICGGTWAECQSFVRTDLFNGRRRLPPVGTVIQVREDGSLTIGVRGE